MSPAHRIASLLPAATELVHALGAGDELVAISHECDYPANVAHLPRITAGVVDGGAAAADIDAAVRALAADGRLAFLLDPGIVAIAPTVMLTQTLCELCAVSEGDVRAIASLVSPPPQVVPMTGTTLDGIWSDFVRVGDAIGRRNEATALVASIAQRLLAVHTALKTARAPRPRVAVIEWLDPLFAAGHWTPELVRRAGGIDVLAAPGAHSVQVDIEHVRHAVPQLLLFAPCGFDVARAERDARTLLGEPAWAWARELEAWCVDGNALTSRPGPRLADAVEVMAAISAPSVFTAPSHAYARRVA
ncbi:MAG: ABC transporter substrate-binding protein [bacterium]